MLLCCRDDVLLNIVHHSFWIYEFLCFCFVSDTETGWKWDIRPDVVNILEQLSELSEHSSGFGRTESVFPLS